MKSIEFKLEKNLKILPPISSRVKKTKFNLILDSLNRVKDEIEKKPKSYQQISMKYEFSNILKRQLKEKYNEKLFTNASVKLIELIMDFNLFDVCDNKSYVFDGASFPGGWVVVFELLKKHNVINYKKYYASSYFGESSLKSEKTSLYDEHNMFYKNEGDVRDVENLDYIYEKVKDKKIMVYTSDLGMDVGTDYNKQEEINAMAHLGQTILGLMILNSKGNMVIKTYTYFTNFSKSIVYILSSMFKSVSIVKPPSSKANNSETYIVCKYYLKNNMKIIEELKNVLKDFKKYEENKFTELPELINNLEYFYLEDLNKFYADNQIEKLKLNDIAYFIEYGEKINIFNKYTKNQINEWYKSYDF